MHQIHRHSTGHGEVQRRDVREPAAKALPAPSPHARTPCTEAAETDGSSPAHITTGTLYSWRVLRALPFNSTQLCRQLEPQHGFVSWFLLVNIYSSTWYPVMVELLFVYCSTRCQDCYVYFSTQTSLWRSSLCPSATSHPLLTATSFLLSTLLLPLLTS